MNVGCRWTPSPSLLLGQVRTSHREHRWRPKQPDHAQCSSNFRRRSHHGGRVIGRNSGQATRQQRGLVRSIEICNKQRSGQQERRQKEGQSLQAPTRAGGPVRPSCVINQDFQLNTSQGHHCKIAGKGGGAERAAVKVSQVSTGVSEIYGSIKEKVTAWRQASTARDSLAMRRGTVSTMPLHRKLQRPERCLALTSCSTHT